MTSRTHLRLVAFAVGSILMLNNHLVAQPTLSISLIPKVSVTAQPGTVSAIQYTTNLSDQNAWVTLTTVPVTSSPVEYLDPAGITSPRRYYRAMAFSTNPAPVDMVWITPGTFTMGSPTNEVGRLANEGPQTIVTISRGFWISRYEITQSQFTNVMGPWSFYFSGNNLPAESVSWNDAVNYCSRLTDSERQAGRLPLGYVYRLPSEAEWEYAARASSTTRYYFGDDPTGGDLPNYAWYTLNSNGQTQPIGTKQPNLWGLYDVEGNVSEWCLDYYSASLPGGSVTDPVGPSSGYKLCRGGSFASTATQVRSAARYSVLSATLSSYSLGFRLVLGPELP